MEDIGKIIIYIGGILIVVGFVLTLGQKLGLGKLTGDILIKKKNFTFFFPITSTVLISIIVTLLISLFKRLF